jgi:hypothetical protein
VVQLALIKHEFFGVHQTLAAEFRYVGGSRFESEAVII